MKTYQMNEKDRKTLAKEIYDMISSPAGYMTSFIANELVRAGYEVYTIDGYTNYRFFKEFADDLRKMSYLSETNMIIYIEDNLAYDGSDE